MKLEHLVFDFDKFASEMQNLKDKKHFDYLVTIVGEDFGAEEGLGCVYILENTDSHERCSVKMLAKVVDGESVIPTVTAICIIAAPEGIKFVEENIDPSISFRVVVCGVDEGLNSKSYIVPGLGDAGDRLYGVID